MAYTPTNWQDYPNLGTPITAARLNNMETGISHVNGGIIDSDVASNAAIAWSKLAGVELDYATITTSGTASTTSEAAATTLITGNSVTYDGTRIKIEWMSPSVSITTSTAYVVYVILRDSTVVGQVRQDPVSSSHNPGCYFAIWDTPSAAAHTYTLKAFVSLAATVTFGAGAGGSGALTPAYLRVARA